MLPLRELQLRFAAVLSGPSGAVDPVLLGLISGRGALGSAERLEIYADMYQARLLDVLRDDFPRVLAVIGDEAFCSLAGRYLARHPSEHPSVRYVGRRFPDFVATDETVPPFLADLARLEWARVDVFDALDGEPLRLADLTAIAPDDWSALRLRPIPACQVIECAWPAHEIWAAADAPASEPGPCTAAATTIRVWREGWAVSHAAMGDVERRVFPLLQRGEPFGALCGALERDREPEAAAQEAGSLLMRWLEDGLLARLPSAPLTPGGVR